MRRTLGLFLLAACMNASAQTGKIRSITLERTPCFGTCPVYTLTLNADGTATYNGVRFADRTGRYKGTFWAGNLGRLFPFLERVGFWKMQDRYTVAVTDQSTQIVTVVTDKGKKTVREYGHGGPAELWALQTLIDGLGAGVKDWKKAK